MPYRRYRRRRFTRRPYRRFNRGFSKKQIGIIKGLAKKAPEPKFIDTTIDMTGANPGPFAGNGIVTFISGCSNGDDYTQREGRKIGIQSIHIEGDLAGNSANMVNDVFVRYMLVKMKTPTGGALPAVGDILYQDEISALRNLDTMENFTILLDKKFVLRQNAVNGANNDPKRLIKYYKRFKRLQTATYTNTTSAIADSGEGHFFVILMSDAVANSWIDGTVRTRVVFKD